MLNKILTPKGLWVLLLAYFGLQVVLRTVLTPTLDLDEAEQVFFSQWWLLGYGPQPPLYNWLQHGLFDLIGTHVFALALLKNCLLLATYYFVYLSAKNLLANDAWAAVATLWLLLLPQIAWESQRDLSHSVIVTSSAAMMLYFITAIIKQDSWINYAWLGISSALLMLSKYNGIIFLVPIAMAIASFKDYRHLLWTPKLLLTAAIAAILLLPHYSWLLAHLDQASTESLDKLTSGEKGIHTGILSLVEAILLFSILAILVTLTGYGIKPWFTKEGSFCTHLFERFFGCLLLLLVIISIATEAGEFKDRWMLPALFCLPIYLVAKIALGTKAKTPSVKLIMLPLLLMILIPLVIAARVIWSSDLENKERLNIPYSEFVSELQATYPTADLLIASNSRQAGNLHLQWQSLPTLALDKPGYGHSIVDDKQAILFIWRADQKREMPAFVEAFIDEEEQGDWQWQGDAEYREINYLYFSRKTATWGIRLLVHK